MKLDINEVYHNYIIRIVIFALFTYKRLIRKPQIYIISVVSFVEKRLPWKINLIIDVGLRVSKAEERTIFIDELLSDVKSDYLSFVTVTFRTPLKEITMKIDLSDESKYEKYLYE
jgi:hypothetical protein